MQPPHTLHRFSIPVMGTGHSIDSPIRVGPYGIDSVISIVDDLLVEKIRRHYCDKLGYEYRNIPRKAEDGRARRITAYLDTVQKIVTEKFETIENQPFFEENDKAKYFRMLPEGSSVKEMYRTLMETGKGKVRDQLSFELSRLMKPGSIDVNIMAKVDKLNYTGGGTPMSAEFSDASSALRGYANSALSSSLILSAGFNPRLYNYLTEFKDFYRDAHGIIKKRIILKVSDFRSALIQGKYLAKKGLEVFEYRIESGLNCGGHAFPSEGHLLPYLLREFREKKDQLISTVQPLIKSWYKEQRGGFPEEWETAPPRLTVQGGIGTSGEAQRLLKDFGMDATGWGSPFLLVPEATAVDPATRRLLEQAGESELYLSGVSPLGVPFNNVRGSGSAEWHRERIEQGKPGSPCPKGFLKSNTEFTEQPICTSSTEYQLLKLDQIARSEMSSEEKRRNRLEVLDKQCLCDHLGNGALIELGIMAESRAPQSICPGPNLAWFDGEYTLPQMVDHIYGRGPSLAASDRPHMFANEIRLYVDYVEELATLEETALKTLETYRQNLEKGMEYCLEVANSAPYRDENLKSIPPVVAEQRARLAKIIEAARPKIAVDA